MGGRTEKDFFCFFGHGQGGGVHRKRVDLAHQAWCLNLVSVA